MPKACGAAIRPSSRSNHAGRTGYLAGQQGVQPHRRPLAAAGQRQLRGLCLGDHGREATGRWR